MGYTSLKAALDAYVKTNGSQSITGAGLNQVMTQLLQGVDVMDRKNGVDTTGLTYKVLQSGSSFASQVTDTNTIYEIRDQFNLGNASVSIPAGCVLKFNGGKLSNGTLTGVFSVIAGRVTLFNNVTIDKINGDVFPEWFGAVPDGSTDCTSAMQAALNSATCVRLGVGTYVCASAILMPRNSSLIGDSDFNSVLCTNGIRTQSLNIIARLKLTPYNSSTDYVIDINSQYLDRAYACVSIRDIIFDPGDGFTNTTFLRIKVDSTGTPYGFYGIGVVNVQHISGRIKDMIRFEADTSNTSHRPWLTTSFFKDIFSSGCKNVLNCVMDDYTNTNYIFMNCVFDNVSSQFNPDYSERFASLANISGCVFKFCGTYDSGAVKPFYLNNDTIWVGIVDNIEKSILNIFESASGKPAENILLNNAFRVSGMSTGSDSGPIHMISIGNANYDITGSAPQRPGIFPCFWYTSSSDNFRGLRISNYSTLGATRQDALLGVNANGQPVCAVNKGGTDAFDVRLIYSDAYVPRSTAAAMPTTKKVLGAMLYQTNAAIPVWYNNSIGGWFNADGVKIDASVTAIRGTTAVMEALSLNAGCSGLKFYDTTLKKYVMWRGTRWVELDGTSLQKSGTTAQRPTQDRPTGFCYFDTDLGKPIWWSGSAWVDATGTAV